MNMDTQYPLILATEAAVFLFVFSLWMIGVVIYYVRRRTQAERLEERLGFSPSGKYDNSRVLELWYEGEYVTTVVPRRSLWGRIRLRIEQLREHLGWRTVPLYKVFLGLIGLGAAAFFAGYGFAGDLLAGLVAVGGALAIPFQWAKRRANQQARLFENQLAEALDLAARSLRAGHPLGGAFRLIGEEIDDPVGGLFAEVMQQHDLGVSMHEAIRSTAARSASEDLKLFASATVIQLQGGGNLADMLERLAVVVRSRVKLQRRVKVLTAEAQMSKRALMGLPIVLFGLLYVTNREYLEPMFNTPAGNMMLLAGGVMMVIGSWVMNRLAVLRY